MNTDTRREILHHLDIHNLQNICVADKNLYTICHDKDFWRQYFNNHQLLLPEIGDLTLNEWVKLYHKILLIDDRVNQILTIMSGPVHMIGYENSYKSDGLDLSNVNMVTINNDIDKIVLNFINSLGSYPLYTIGVFYRDGYYLSLYGSNYDPNLSFSENLSFGNKSKAYKINKDVAYHYIFNMLYYRISGMNSLHYNK